MPNTKYIDNTFNIPNFKSPTILPYKKKTTGNVDKICNRPNNVKKKERK